MSKRPYIVGKVEGVPVGSTFATRQKLAESGLHRPVRKGIDYATDEPACSIVLSYGYQSDKDMGNTVIYSGEGGGLDPSTSGRERQIKDQEWKRGNRALLRAYMQDSPVRLIRSHRSNSEWRPSAEEGLRYDGLYSVAEADLVKNKKGLNVCIFKLLRLPGQPPIPRPLGYRPVTMSDSTDSEDSDEGDQPEEERNEAPNSMQSRPVSILDLPLDSDSDSEEDDISPATFRSIPATTKMTSPGKRKLDLLRRERSVSSNLDDWDDKLPSPSKKRRFSNADSKLVIKPEVHKATSLGGRVVVHTNNVIEILDSEEEEVLARAQMAEDIDMPFDDKDVEEENEERAESHKDQLHGHHVAEIDEVDVKEEDWTLD